MTGLDWPRDGRHNFIAGKWAELPDVARIPSVSPIDETVIGHVAAADGDAVARAVEAIRPSLLSWANTAPSDRRDLLTKLAAAIDLHAAELVETEIVDSGLTRRTAIRDVNNSVEALALYGSYCDAIHGETFPAGNQTLAFTERIPFGIVARIVPFNHPIMFAVQAIASTVIAGNAVIVKPPEQCSLSTLALAEICREIFPAGVVNVMTGYGHDVGSALVQHREIPRIGFTGSVPTGRRILAEAAAHVKQVSLELGGKNPIIVTDTADPEFAADVVLRGMNFTHAGQSCQSTSRLFVHEKLSDDVVGLVEARMRALNIGDPRDAGTDVGPLAFAAHFERVRSYIEIGVREGATLRVGGERPPGLDRGFYLYPTMFTEVTDEMRIAREEIFGPVLAVSTWSDPQDVLRRANDTEFGLNSRVVAGDASEALSLARGLAAGSSLVNTVTGRPAGMPFGGHKESGLGVQGCLEEVLSYTQEKSYVIGSLVA